MGHLSDPVYLGDRTAQGDPTHDVDVIRVFRVQNIMNDDCGGYITRIKSLKLGVVEGFQIRRRYSHYRSFPREGNVHGLVSDLGGV